ncbi:MerR family transcriptional regulator [Solihabitans fulvus]|uniref:MerR family transcriptional regulator n=1 Tax=Solihabitans fulvus TaxID=1892852 RepID=A0A5B2WYA3_9PSEU|nr:MerR family transcriptional regulator [Solihabitans fulvus]KAA2256943.1 MerR family transcriptional regulator [Solihabitans fulvus]
MIGNEGADQRRWSVGELARASGLTVRALHHYDEIGLVVPSERTHAGHRRYTEVDVRRLYRVRALRSLGLPLEEIGEVLGGAEDWEAVRDLLANQLTQLDAEASRVENLRAQVRGLLARLDSSVMPDSTEFLNLLETMMTIESYYTPEQQEYLAKRRDELGEEGLKQGQQAWVEVIAGFTEHQRAGTPVEDPEVRALAQRWADLVAAMHGGNEGVRESMNKLYRERRAELNPSLSDELNDYVRAAMQAGGISS